MKMKLFEYKFTNEELSVLKDLHLYLILAALTGETRREIACNFGIPVGTVKSRINRATKKLLENRQNATSNGTI